MGKIGNSTYTMNDWTDLRIKFNSDSGANYSFIFMYGTGSAAGSSRSANAGYIRGGEYAISANSNYFSSFACNIQNYANTSTHKTLIGRWGIPQGNGTVGLSAGVWRNTSAIDSVTITSDGSWPFMTGTTLTIYGISAA